jgi:hypothetical protein
MPPELREGDVDGVVHDPGTDARRLERAMHLYRRDSEAQLDAQQRQITELTNANAVARQELDALLAVTMATKRSKRTERYEDTGAEVRSPRARNLELETLQLQLSVGWRVARLRCHLLRELAPEICSHSGK